jgi:hypothetical protein
MIYFYLFAFLIPAILTGTPTDEVTVNSLTSSRVVQVPYVAAIFTVGMMLLLSLILIIISTVQKNKRVMISRFIKDIMN